MKAKITNLEPSGFKPVDITFTIESVEEGEALYCLFNHYGLCQFMGKHFHNNDFPSTVRGIMDNAGLGQASDITWNDFLDSIKK